MRNNFFKTNLYTLGTLAIVVAGFASYSFIASRSVQQDLRNWLTTRLHNESLSPKPGEPGYPPKGSIRLPANIEVVSVWSPEGVFNQYSDQDTYPEVVVRSIEIAFGNRPELLDWGMRYPFLIPAVIHFGFIGFLPLEVKLARSKTLSIRSGRSFAKHAMIAAFYAYVITVLFQSGRMLWGSWAWDFKYFGRFSYPYGPFALYLFFGLCIFMYLYCVIGTAGLQVRRKPTAKKQTCIRCGYGTEGLDRCPECDLEVGAFIPSKWRVNHWYLAAMFVVTFFSPVMVASVYSFFG